MNEHHERPYRYSLKTLQAMYDGAVSGRVSAHGALRVTITDEDHHTYTARVISVGYSRLTVRLDDGTVRTEIRPAWVGYAEVV